jgi:hypothetical protein
MKMRSQGILGLALCIAAGAAACGGQYGTVGQEAEKAAPQLDVVSATTLNPITPVVPMAAPTDHART